MAGWLQDQCATSTGSCRADLLSDVIPGVTMAVLRCVQRRRFEPSVIECYYRSKRGHEGQRDQKFRKAYCHSMPDARDENSFGRVDKYECILCKASMADPVRPHELLDPTFADWRH